MGQKKRSPDQGLKLLLIRDYLYKEASAEHPQNSKDIQEFLAKHEIKASTRTIQEDVRRLRDILNIPIAYKRTIANRQPQTIEPFFLAHRIGCCSAVPV